MTRLVFAVALLALASHATATTVQAIANQSVVVGLSSGGFAAVQMHVAFSSSLVGAGIIAGGPFYCAKNSEITATEVCQYMPELIDVDELVGAAKDCESGNACDPLEGLAAHKVYLFSGTADTIVNQGTMRKAQTFYEAFVPSAQIHANFTVPAEHSWPTNNWGNSCGTLSSPYINNCGFDSSRHILEWILGDIKAPTTAVESSLFSFSQQTYTPNGESPSSLSLGPNAYIYAPAACQNTQCRLIIAYHGCAQTLSDIGYDFIAHVGLNELAEANNFLVLYPQAIKSYIAPSNPEGCFDWWGYTNGDYANRNGPQMVTVKNMLNAIVHGLNL